MPTSQAPDQLEPPPSYETATAPAASSSRVSSEVPGARTARNGIPPEHRRSMEDESRPLPPGWIRQFDPIEQHQFFVDTKADPPRSIWVHPYDDAEFLATLPPEERRKHSRMHRSVTLEDLAAEDSDDDGHPPRATSRNRAAAEPSPSGAPDRPRGLHKFTRKVKDRLTETTHQQREAQRVRRAEEERRAYVAHMKVRQAMVRALETGEPQFLGRDAQGRDVYIEPPSGRMAPRGAFGYNPYVQGPYGVMNSRYMRPAGPYGRPYGMGYGGGLGAPVAAGLLGGALMGGLLF